MAAKKGSRAQEILQTLARMLETSRGRITTAALAGELGLSEAALYRHFPSKTRMYESLIDFIEETIFGRVRAIVNDEPDAVNQCYRILSLVVAFCQKNPGITRILNAMLLRLRMSVYTAELRSFLIDWNHSSSKHCAKQRSATA